MKSLFYIIACIVCTLLIEYAVYENEDVLAVLLRMFLKVLLFVGFMSLKPVSPTLRYVIFIVVIFISDFLSLLTYVDNIDFGYGIGFSFFIMYAVLVYDGWKQFKVGRFDSIVLSYVVIMAINLALMVMQLRSVYAFLNENKFVFAAQVLYHIMLLVVVGVSVGYYLNSYSKKAMYYLMGGLLFVCSDILNGAHYFYGIDRIILIFSTLMSAAGYYFFIGYFYQKEEPLLTEAELLLDLESR